MPRSFRSEWESLVAKAEDEQRRAVIDKTCGVADGKTGQFPPKRLPSPPNMEFVATGMGTARMDLGATKSHAAGDAGSGNAPTRTSPRCDSSSAVVAQNKFRNVATDGHASKREAKRAKDLIFLQRSGSIRNLRKQVKYLLIPAQYIGDKCVERACTYTADFVYEESPTWRTVVEDVKGFPNDRWPIKRKLMLFVHGLQVRET